jgi:hypothetical protein
VLKQPLVILFQEYRADQPSDAGLVWEDADHIGPPFNLLVQAFQRVSGMQLGPVLGRESHVGEHVMLAVVHQRGELGPARAQLIGDMPPSIVRRLGIGLQKGLPDRSGDHRVLALGHVRERIAHPMNSASLPARTEHAGDRQAQTLVGVRDHQLDALQAAPDQALDEAGPERFGLRWADPEADDLAPAFGRNRNGDYCRNRDDAAALAHLQVGGIEP